MRHWAATVLRCQSTTTHWLYMGNVGLGLWREKLRQIQSENNWKCSIWISRQWNHKIEVWKLALINFICGVIWRKWISSSPEFSSWNTWSFRGRTEQPCTVFTFEGHLLRLWSWVVSVGVATGYWLDGRRVTSSCSRCPDRLCGRLSFYTMGRGDSFHEVRRPGCETDLLLPTSAEIKKTQICKCSSP